VTTQTSPTPVGTQEILAPPSSVFERPQARRLMLGAITAVYLICCFSLALTRAPWYDEGFVVNPSYAWITSGHPGMSILDDSGPFLPFPQRMSLKGIHEHLYAQMPLHMVFLAGWFKVLGFGLVRARIFTILCGLIVLFSCYWIVRRLTTDAAVAFAAFSLDCD
jgi:4-amino-4-deoxy-L-arabinose transferase-like glycosyltransferase